MEQVNEYPDEIDLRQYIEVLWRGKWIIITVTLCAMASAGIISFFLLDPVYESSAVITVSLPEEVQAGLGDPVIAGIIGGTPQAHARLLQSQAVLQQVAATLETRDIRFSAHALGTKITAKPIGDAAKGDKLLEITAQDKIPENAKAIADTAAAEYVAFLSDLVRTRMSSRKEALATEISQRETTLADATKSLSELMGQSGGLKLVEQEIEAKTALLANYEGENARLAVEARAVGEALRVLENQLKATPEKLSIKRSFSDAVIVTSGVDPGAATFTSEEVNPAYAALMTEVAQKRATLAELNERIKAGRDAISTLSADLDALSARLIENAVTEQKLRERLDAAQTRYVELAAQLQELEGIQPQSIVRSAIDVVAPASLPVEPSGPRKLLNIAIAGVLGVVVSVFVVFVMNYWQGTQSATVAR